MEYSCIAAFKLTWNTINNIEKKTSNKKISYNRRNEMLIKKPQNLIILMRKILDKILSKELMRSLRVSERVVFSSLII